MQDVKIFYEDGKQYRITVNIKLYYIKGNKVPYFSITGEIWKSVNGKRIGRDCIACGCIHEEIIKHFGNKYNDIINLHLSDINGGPMYAVENGWYWYQKDPAKGFNYIRLPEHMKDYEITDKDSFIALVDYLKPEYKKQADNCIAKYNLVITGDKWEGQP